MKKITLVATAIFFWQFVFGQISRTLQLPGNFIFNIQNGDRLIYKVSANGDTYNFEVTVKENLERLYFDWFMPQKDFNGQVILEKEARANATIYKNIFQNGDEWNFKDSATVWFSRKNFMEAKKGSTTLVLDESPPVKFTTEAGETFKILYKGREVNLRNFNLKASSDNVDRSLRIMDNPSNSLILRMNLGWTIILKEVQ